MSELFIVVNIPAGGIPWGQCYSDQKMAIQEYQRQLNTSYNGQTIIFVGVSLAGVKELLRYEPK